MASQQRSQPNLLSSSAFAKQSLQLTNRTGSFMNQTFQEEKPEPEEDTLPEKTIDRDMVVKNGMTTDYKKITDLSLVEEGITRIDYQNSYLKNIGTSLRTFNLSLNHLKCIEHLEFLTNLRELKITYNKIKTMDGLSKLVNLRTLTLDRNLIKSITGIRHLRKLEKLSLIGNQIKEVSPTDSSEPMIDLKELCLQYNNIKCIEQVHSYPNLEDLDVSNNPISMVFPGAFQTVTKLTTLSMNDVKLRSPVQDLLFLKKLENLNRLSLNKSFPTECMENLTCFSGIQMPELEDLSIQKVGLLMITGIGDHFPNLTNLDLSYNKIFKVEAIEELHTLHDLAEVSFHENPICVHKHLKEMVSEVVPNIEMVN